MILVLHDGTSTAQACYLVVLVKSRKMIFIKHHSTLTEPTVILMKTINISGEMQDHPVPKWYPDCSYGDDGDCLSDSISVECKFEDI